ncbi:MAG TPA: PEP-CTERM sorting domain-containing protein [Candidatus Acidoferrales bacterium]|nr:PEP-CTERM sorting domain-containing protein [Candidatus Acidoferrales bacterium]
MKITWKVALIAVALALFSASNAFADTTFTLTGVQGNYLGGVYTSPYYATIGTTANIPVICDDFASESYVNETWQTIVTNASQLTSSSPVRWATSNLIAGSEAASLGEFSAYAVAADLATEIMNATPGSAYAQELSYALWGLFDPNAFSSTYLNSTQAGIAMGYMMDAVNSNPTLSQYSNVTIYSYDPAYGTSCAAGTTCPPPPQEFLVVNTPEPSTILMLALGLGGLLMLWRRRKNAEVLAA